MANPQEELDEQIKQTQEQLDKEENDDTSADTEADDPQEEAETTIEDTEEDEEAPKEEAVKEEDEDKSKKQTVEDRYKESTKEAQELHEDNKKMDEALHDAYNIPDPTDEQLRKEFPEWEEMNATERRLAKDSLVNKQFRATIQKAAEERRSVHQWTDKVDEFLDNPKTFIHNPELEGKQDPFRVFANEKGNRNVNLNILIPAFLHLQAKSKPAPKKGQMFEAGSAGSKEPIKVKSDKLSVEESQRLMSSDFNKWKEYLKAGKLANE